MENATVLTYLGKRDYPIDPVYPFNYIDAFVLAVFAYLPVGSDLRNYDGPQINPSGLTLGKFAEKLLNNNYDSILKTRFSKSRRSYEDYRSFCEKVIENDRYKDIEIVDFQFENGEESQFAAYAFHIGGNEYCISYRGTDGTYEGWYENFMLLNEDTEAQRKAAEFLAQYLSFYSKGVFYLTGHSKGGNLSAYAAIQLCPGNDRVLRSFNFDGPGFNEEYLNGNTRAIQAVSDRMEAFFIENTVVGELLFGQRKIYRHRLYFIKAEPELNFLWQHSPFTWLIEQDDFVFTYQSAVSRFINEKLDFIVKKTPASSLTEAVKLYFALIGAFGSVNTDDIKKAVNAYIEGVI